MTSAKKILIADDDTTIHLPLKFYLNEKGYEVMLVENGLQAFQAIQTAIKTRKGFDLLITDIEMPELTGLELIDKLHEHHFKLPIIVITGFGTKEISMELVKRGCEAYLEKPINEAKLVDLVATELMKEGD